MCKILSRIQELSTNEGITIGALEKKIGASKGVLSRAIAKGTDIQAKWIEALVENYPQYSAEWLLTGQGSMIKLNDDINNASTFKDPKKPNSKKKLPTERETLPLIAFDHKEGTPYYDVDFIGGFAEIVNNQNTLPEGYIKVAGFGRAQFFVNMIGTSMLPSIKSGDILGLRQCTLDDVQYGQIYAVVLDTLRTVKILRKSSDPTKLRFIPDNTAEYDEQEFDKSRIINIFEVVGAISINPF